jgi:DNA-directed RNA polymerase specialized sigma24 family protein
MAQELFGDPASLLRSVLDDLTRAAYGLLGHHADAEDAVQNGCCKLL